MADPTEAMKVAAEESANLLIRPQDGKNHVADSINEGADIEVSEVSVTETKLEWSELENFKLSSMEYNPTRNLSDISEINRIYRHLSIQLLQKNSKWEEADKEFKIMPKYLKAVEDIDNEAFLWENYMNDLDDMLSLVKLTCAKQLHIFDVQLIDHTLVQKMFSVQMIGKLLGEVNRLYGKPVYDKSLRIQTCLIEIFLFHHLKADTKFHPKITTTDLNLIDPFFRIRTRDRNRGDDYLKSKYQSATFDLKKFILNVLDLYFPNVTWRYVGGGQEMHRWALKCVLTMFELGLWEYHELVPLVTALFQKLENLNVLERRSYEDFKTTLVNYPTFISNLKGYFYDCKELVAGICLQVVVLLNDQSFINSHNFFNKSPQSLKINKQAVWKDAYFNNTDIANILYRVLTTYLLNFSNRLENEETRNRLINYLNDFIMIITDHQNDVCSVSARVVNQSMIDYYTSKPNENDVAEATIFSKNFQAIITEFALKTTSKTKKERLERNLMEHCNRLITSIRSRAEGNDQEHFKYQLGENSLPVILLCIISLCIENEVAKQTELIVIVTFTEICKGNTINQVQMLSEGGLQHLQNFFTNKQLIFVSLLGSIFKDSYKILFVHKSILEFFFKSLKSTMGVYTDIQKQDTIGEWFLRSLQTPIITDSNSSNLSAILSYYGYCKFILSLIEARDINFDSKFLCLMIQEIILPKFRSLYMKIILDETFLNKSENGVDYEFKPVLEGSTNQVQLQIMERCENGKLSVDELKSIVLEVAFMTLKVVCKSCQGLYLKQVYDVLAKVGMNALLNQTKYLLRLKDEGIDFRTSILELFNIFFVFPSNGALTNRLEFNADPLTKTRETMVSNTLKTEVPAKIMEVLKDYQSVADAINSMDQEKRTRACETYYFMGIMPIVIKYTKALWYLYTFDEKLELLLNNMVELKSILQTVSQHVLSNFNVAIYSEAITETNNMSAASNQVMPAKSSKSKSGRRVDPDDQLKPKLLELRNLLSDLIEALERAYDRSEKYEVLSMADKLRLMYKRNCPVTATVYNPEPWTTNVKSVEVRDSQSNDALSNTQALKALDLAKVFVTKTGLTSQDIRYFHELMGVYQENKTAALERGGDENIFIKFLNSKNSNTANIVLFLSKLSEWFFGDNMLVKLEGDTDDISFRSTNNADMIVKVFLESQVLFTCIRFFSSALISCTRVRQSFLDNLANEKGELKPEWSTTHFISIIYYVGHSLGSIYMFKPFHDIEREFCGERFRVIMDFLKNFAENNFQPFKRYFGTFVPSILGIPAFNAANHTLFYNHYVRTEGVSSYFVMSGSRPSSLTIQDHPETMSVVISLLRLTVECCNGPCQTNQDKIFHFRTDLYMGLIYRFIDYADTSFYQLKAQALEYVLSLIEGNNQLSTLHFGRNNTFNSLYDLIYTTLKQLYVYATVSEDPSKYRRLARDARKHAMKVKAQEEELRLKNKANQKTSVIGADYDIYNSRRDLTDPVLHAVKTAAMEELDELDCSNPKIITKEIMNFVKVDDYEKIFSLFIKDQKFSSHILLQIAIKLNELLIRFSDCSEIGGYGICLDNVYLSLIDRYGDEVPPHVLRKYSSYEPKEVNRDTFNEKHVFYMFLTKITAQIDLVNPSTKEPLSILYPKLPNTFFLTNQTKTKFIRTATTDAMLVDLIANFKTLEDEMNNNLSFYRKHPTIYLLTSDDAFWYTKYILYVLGLALNVILVVFYRRDRDGESYEGQGQLIMTILGIAIASLSFIVLVAWFFSRYTQKAALALSKLEDEDLKQGKRTHRLVKFFKVKIYRAVLAESYPLIFVIHMVSSLLGIFVNPFFYSLQLLMIVSLFDTTNYVVQAITTHFDQLTLTFVLAVVVMYCYSVLAASLFWDTLNNNQPGSSDPVICTELWDCLLYTVNYGLRNGGGISDATQQVDPLDNSGRYVAKFFFDITFFMMINVISLNIIFGIIIDTFAAMREENDARGRPDINSRFGSIDRMLRLRKAAKRYGEEG